MIKNKTKCRFDRWFNEFKNNSWRDRKINNNERLEMTW